MNEQLALNLNAMSADALQKLLAEAQAALSAKAKIEKLRADITALIEAEGLTVADVFPPVVHELPAALGASRRGRKPKSAADAGGGFTAPASRQPKGDAKYENPADPAQKWTGKGRKPQWVIDALAAGTTLEALLIK